LAVNGTIKAKEIVVESTGWSDFVFDNKYPLITLGELERYINANKHLPEIPSAGKVAKSGINLGDMQTKLLQKVEELTLYMIQFEKRNAMLKDRLEVLEKEQM